MTTSSEADILSAARQYLAQGLSPILLDGKKPILPDWTNLPRATYEDVNNWFANGGHRYYYNIGIRCGSVSGGIVVLDIDGQSGQDKIDSLDLSASLKSKLNQTRQTKTGFGFHLWLRCSLVDFPEGIKSLVLWRQNIQDVKPGGKAGEILVQGDGKQVVAWPSKHPVTGTIYQTNDDKPIQELTRQEYEELTASFGNDRVRGASSI